jgi:Toxin with endonuclease activity, of toxin-antitoxin system
VSENQPLVINGWSIFAHPLFLNQFEELLMQVEYLRQKHPQDYKQKNAAKRLAAIAKLAFDVIPQDPTRSDIIVKTLRLGKITSTGLGLNFSSSIDYFFDIIKRVKLLSLLGLMMTTLSELMKLAQTLIEFSRRCLKAEILQMIGMTYSKR